MSLSSNLSASLLEKLYLKDKLSTYKIATIFQCDPKTIYRYLKEYDIETRPLKKQGISKVKLKNLYENRKMSLLMIGKIYKMTPSGIMKRMKKFNITLREPWITNTGLKKPFTGTLVEKAYLIGFRLGDLGVRKSSNKTQMVKVGSNTTKKEQVELIDKLFKRYSKVWVGKPNNIGVVSISTILHPSFLFLLPKTDNIENWIRTNNKLMAVFVAGYIDAEGSFGIYNGRAKFRIGSYDKKILKQISTWLRKIKIKSVLKLESKKKISQNKDFWRITVNEAKSLVKLYEIVFPSLKHSKRISDFIKVVKNINSRAQNGTIQL